MKSNRKSVKNPDHVSEDVKRILIVKPSSLGDIFHVFPAVARLGELFPNAQFDWLIHPAFAEALDFAPVPVARKIIFRRRELGKLTTMIPEFMELTRQLRKIPYDYVFDFQGLVRSAFFARLARGKVVGFARPREPMARWFYHRWCKVNLRLHAVRRNQLLVERFFHTGTMRTAVKMPSCPQYRESLDKKIAQLDMRPGNCLIGISPGARWESKVFPPDLFAKTIMLISEMRPDARFVVMGAPADQKTAEKIQLLAGLAPVYSLAGSTSLGELVELINRCDTVLANDSGPVHIAAAANVPVVCFYGPTNPNLTGPFGDIHTIFQRGDLNCIKCMRRKCSKAITECHNIDAAAVAAAVCKKIEEK
ncbi:MAG: glycosyltransferase family 9 protein [Lentisphaerae bacterium]|nr:glycosyltransferase family 9 protein [Lentisphaerota bacterium]